MDHLDSGNITWSPNLMLWGGVLPLCGALAACRWYRSRLHDDPGDTQCPRYGITTPMLFWLHACVMHVPAAFTHYNAVQCCCFTSRVCSQYAVHIMLCCIAAGTCKCMHACLAAFVSVCGACTLRALSMLEGLCLYFLPPVFQHAECKYICRAALVLICCVLLWLYRVCNQQHTALHNQLPRRLFRDAKDIPHAVTAKNTGEALVTVGWLPCLVYVF